MERTIENVTRLLEAMRSNCHAVAEVFQKRGNSATEAAWINQALGLHSALMCFTDHEYFNGMCDAFGIK